MALMRRSFIPVSLVTLAGLLVGRLWLSYVRWEGVGVARMGLAQMVAGTADRPFVTRALPAWVIGALAAFTSWPLGITADAVAYLSAVLWLLALWWLADAVLSPRAAFVAALAAAGPVGLLFVSGGYTYDLPTLALFTLALGMLAHRKWNHYLVVFAGVALCRETALLLIPVYWLWRRRASPDPAMLAKSAGLQLLVFFGIRAGLAWLYRNNPGSAFEIHWWAHYWFLFEYPFPNVLALSVYGLAVLIVLLSWRRQPAFLQDAAIVIPIIFAAYWMVGFPGEIRVVLEAYPPLFLLVFNSIWPRDAAPVVKWLGKLAA
jgi:hypothetical protein